MTLTFVFLAAWDEMFHMVSFSLRRITKEVSLLLSHYLLRVRLIFPVILFVEVIGTRRDHKFLHHALNDKY